MDRLGSIKSLRLEYICSSNRKYSIRSQVCSHPLPVDHGRCFRGRRPWGRQLPLWNRGKPECHSQTGYKFIRWNGAGITNLYDSSTTLKIDTNVTIEPIFEAQKYFLQTKSSKGGIALGQGYYQYGQKVEITAVPSTGYKFAGWEGEGISQPELLSTTIQVTQDTLVRAQFSIIDNYFTPFANDFSLFIDRLDIEKRDTLHPASSRWGWRLY